MGLSNRMMRACLLATAMLVLGACAGRQPRPSVAQAVAAPAVAKPAAGKGYRFYMTQNGRKMTADDFDAWLKANGLQVRGGKVVKVTGAGARGAKAASRATAKAKTKPARRAAATVEVAEADKAKAKDRRKKTAAVAAEATRKDG